MRLPEDDSYCRVWQNWLPLLDSKVAVMLGSDLLIDISLTLSATAHARFTGSR